MKWLIGLILVLLSGLCFSQKNIYLSIEAGLGSTFVHINNDNAPNKNLKSIIGPSTLIGLDVRYDFSEKLAGTFGISLLNMGYSTVYTFSPEFSTGNIQYSEQERFLTIPATVKGIFPLHKQKHIYLTISGGLSWGIKVGDMVSGMGVIKYSNADQDSISSATLFYADTKPFSLNVLGGIGLEKKLKKSSRIGFNIISRIGILKTFTGRVEEVYYAQPVFHNPGTPYPYAEPATVSTFFSRNHSLFITFFYAIKLRKNK